MESLGNVAKNYLLYIKSLLNQDSGGCLFLAGKVNESEENNCPLKHILKGFYLFLIDEWEYRLFISNMDSLSKHCLSFSHPYGIIFIESNAA